jgi:RNA polymerase sigma-54 factor
MKQGLQLRLGQQITMTPQLQQAIRLLQLSSLDLQLEVQQALESNIMLEPGDENYEGEDGLDDVEERRQEGEKEAQREETAGDGTQAEATDEMALDERVEIPDDLPVDSQWDDIYDAPPSAGKDHGDDDRDYLDRAGGASESLHDYLTWQLGLTPFSPLDRAIAALIVDAVDEDGYLRASLEDIQQSFELPQQPELDEVAAVLQRLQHFDPPGVAARDLRECLLLQLKQMPADTPWRSEALNLVEHYLELLGSRDYTQLMRKTKLERETLQQVMSLIQSLNPRPGNAIQSQPASYIVPDVFVKKVKGRWQVELNPEVAPRLRINTHYASLISQVHSKSDSDSMKSHLQEARWFIKSLKSRHETLLRVTRCIMEKQSAFLDYGEEAMKPLVLYDIASELEMHESTISRVTTQKYVHTPRGIFELKYFFSSHVNTDSGGECSSTAIRALIKKLIAAENTTKPLSDSKIADLLSNQGIQVARRTVAKYREAMSIPPSNERKSLV